MLKLIHKQYVHQPHIVRLHLKCHSPFILINDSYTTHTYSHSIHDNSNAPDITELTVFRFVLQHLRSCENIT